MNRAQRWSWSNEQYRHAPRSVPSISFTPLTGVLLQRKWAGISWWSAGFGFIVSLLKVKLNNKLTVKQLNIPFVEIEKPESFT